MRLLLIRHGQTHSNVGHHLDTAEPGAELTALGQRQANAVPPAIADRDVDSIVVSTLRRTSQTADPLVRERGLPAVVRPGIREIQAGELEMRNDKESIDRYVETVFGWSTDPERRVPGAENGIEVLARFDQVVRDLAEQGCQAPALFSHGGVIRVWAGLRAANIDLDYAASHWLPNTGLVVIDGDPDSGWHLVFWGEHALGGPALSDPERTGPAGEPEETPERGDPARPA